MAADKDGLKRQRGIRMTDEQWREVKYYAALAGTDASTVARGLLTRWVNRQRAAAGDDNGPTNDGGAGR